MVALTTRRSALALLTVGTVVSFPTAGAATQIKASAMSGIKQLCDRYYDAWGRKDLQAILACVDSEVVFKTPNAATNGRDAYAAAAQKFLGLVARARAAAQGKQ